jgi:hypothetical protein
MASNSIQFRGIESVITAYENREVGPWGLFNGKQFLFKYEGSDVSEGSNTLRTLLEEISKTSNAVYTLKVYEEIVGGRIKENTPSDGSFNFKLDAPEQLERAQQYIGYSQTNKELLQRIEELEERLAERDEPETENKLGVIGEIIGHPTIQPLVQTLLQSIFAPKQPAQVPQQQQPVNNVPMQRVSLNGINDDARLTQAVQALSECDPQLTEHLEKLARLAQDSPDSFKFLIATLDNMQL